MYDYNNKSNEKQAEETFPAWSQNRLLDRTRSEAIVWGTLKTPSPATKVSCVTLG